MELGIIRRIVEEMKFKIARGINTSKLDIENYIVIVEALEKQMPKKVTRDSVYSPALCPTCHTDEICKSLGDGYYQYFTDIEYCPRCGQLIDWD